MAIYMCYTVRRNNLGLVFSAIWKVKLQQPNVTELSKCLQVNSEDWIDSFFLPKGYFLLRFLENVKML